MLKKFVKFLNSELDNNGVDFLNNDCSSFSPGEDETASVKLKLLNRKWKGEGGKGMEETSKPCMSLTSVHFV